MAQRAEIVLTGEEREVLERWARRPTSAQALALRCRIVLAAADGEQSKEIAARLGCNKSTVGRWRGRFARRGIDGLHDEPRPGKPRSIGDDDIERVIVKTLEEQPPNATHWSTRSMAEATGMSQSAISRIWRAFGLKPHLVDSFKLSPDPLIVDKVSTHKTPAVERWLLRRPRFTFHFTPTYSSWLNLVERWFAELTNKKLRRSTHRSIAALEADVRAWIDQWNADPKPFTWTKTADAILETIASYCGRIYD